MFTAGRILFEALEAHFCDVSRYFWVRLLSILANIIMRRASQSTHSSDARPTHRTLEILAFDACTVPELLSLLKNYQKSTDGATRAKSPVESPVLIRLRLYSCIDTHRTVVSRHNTIRHMRIGR
jgi:hypothetical protein